MSHARIDLHVSKEYNDHHVNNIQESMWDDLLPSEEVFALFLNYFRSLTSYQSKCQQVNPTQSLDNSKHGIKEDAVHHKCHFHKNWVSKQESKDRVCPVDKLNVAINIWE